MKIVTIVIIVAGLYLIYDLIKSIKEHNRIRYEPELMYGEKIEFWDSGVNGQGVVIAQISYLVRVRADNGKVYLLPREQCKKISDG